MEEDKVTTDLDMEEGQDSLETGRARTEEEHMQEELAQETEVVCKWMAQVVW